MVIRKFLSSICILLVVVSLFSVMIFMPVNAKNKSSNILFGKVIYIDAGHGGKDNGANVDSILEDEINLKISFYLIESLIDSGAYVLSTRSSDYDLSSIYNKNKKREDLKNRVEYINKSNPDLFISIHLNTFPSDSVSGAQVFHQNNNNSKLLADKIQDKLNILTNKKRKEKIGDYYILNKSERIGVIVECGFLSNKQEREKLVDDGYQSKLASRIKEGVVSYFTSKE